jgi:hypothetical protein
MSVLSAGLERPIDESDFELKKPGNYSLARAGAHATLMNDFACEELAKVHTSIAFSHMSPGFVKTNQVNTMTGVGPVLRSLLHVVSFLATPLTIDWTESGQRTLYNATAKEFGPKGSAESSAIGSDGTKGSGAYLLKWNGNVVGNQSVLKPMRERGAGEKIWKHALDLFKTI